MASIGSLSSLTDHRSRAEGFVGGHFIFLIVIVAIVCVVGIQGYCDECHQSAVQECIMDKEQYICGVQCDSDNCGTSGTCSWTCCDGAPTLPQTPEYHFEYAVEDGDEAHKGN